MQALDVSPASQVRGFAVAALGAGGDAELVPAGVAIAMPMHLGLDAAGFRLVADGATRAYIKCFHAGALAPFTAADAIAAAVAAGELGIAPRVIAGDAGAGCIAFAPLGDGWRLATAHELLRPDRLAQLMELRRRWHAAPALGVTKDPAAVALALAARLGPHLDGRATPTFPARPPLPFPMLVQWVERIAAVLDSRPAGAAVPLHGEAFASNVLLGPDGAMLLTDFDRAVDGDPLADLATLSLDLCRTDEERGRLLTAAVGAAVPADLAQLKLHAVVQDFSWACWAALAEINPATAGPELYKYAHNRWLRMSYHLQHFDMEGLLRQAVGR
ncbi:phosphotransferase family protein [Methylobrevis albus]|uniref:Phosphotransferase n=1 Tax=Methylobrevis albus TaxID=2793297 RepID=A0A931HZA3_9HYPH|nr:phosphotransferase [Methylobrevis albus]MBH0236371.1 phosphotransferase [Methylobrevis albus]